MKDIGRNETVRLEEDDSTDAFENHSAFARISFTWIDYELPVGHLAAHDTTVSTTPTPFDRSNLDDVERAQDDLLNQLASEVDKHCLGVLLDSPGIAVEDVPVAELDAWTRRRILDVRLDVRNGCGIDVLYDTELATFLTTTEGEGHRHFDLGWRRSNVYSMSRHEPVERGLYVVINQQHIIGLSSRASLFFTSQSLDSRSEYLSARCAFAYRPRLDFHPGSVRIARVTFADEDAWKAAARATALP